MTPTRPRIAHVVLTLNPGGVERFLCSLTACDELAGTDQIVCCLDELGVLAPEVVQNGRQVRLEKRGPGFDVSLVWRLARFFREERITAVHTHSLDPMLYVSLAARLARVPVRVHTQHNSFLDTFPAKDLWKFRIAARGFTHLVAVSEQVRRGMLRHGAPASRTRTILNGIDAASYPPRGTETTPKPLVIGYVGRLAPEKAVDRLIRAFAKLCSRYPQLHLRLAGDGPEKSRLQALIKELGITSAVEFAGFVSNVSAVLADIDLFVLPSLTEGIPLALLEAMAASLPVVASAVGGVPEVVVDGKSGLLVPPDDIAALTQALDRLINDATMRVELGRGARARVCETFSLGRMSNAYRSVYQDAPQSTWKEWGKSLLRLLPARLIVWRAAGRPGLALTFDDGPDEYTTRLLDVLRQYNVKATFFLVGERIAGNEAIVRQILGEGHEIANHSFTHPDFDRLAVSAAAAEIRQTEDALSSIQGQPSRFFRPPKGKLCRASLIAAWRARLPIAMWSVDLKDFRARQPQDIWEALHQTPLRPGDVLLYHGNNEAALAALPRVIEHAQAAGEPLVSLSKLLNGDSRS